MSGDTIPRTFNMQKVQDDVLKLWNVRGQVAAGNQPGSEEQDLGSV